MSRFRPQVGRWLAPAALLAAAVLVPQPASAAPPKPGVTVTGWDFDSERTADVVAGSDANNLVLTFTLTAPLDHGSVRVLLPARAWPQPLRAVSLLGSDTARPGDVVVRAQRTAAGEGCLVDPENVVPVTIDNGAGVHAVTVGDLSCVAGQQIAVRVFGLKAPAAVGAYPFGYTVGDTANGVAKGVASLQVVPPPREHLRVVLPPGTFTYGQDITVGVVALTPDNRVDTAYRGGVSLLTTDAYDCSALGQHELKDFTAADRGVKRFTVVLNASVSTRIMAYDVAHKAAPGYSRLYTAIDGDDDGSGEVSCPVSYH